MPNPNSARAPHEFFLRAIASSLIKAAEDGIVPRAEVEECLVEHAALQASGDFFQMWTFVHVTGTV
jgi:hypothetical protein